MAVSFPASPTSGQTYFYNGVTYVYASPVWRISRSASTSGTSGSSGTSGTSGATGTSGSSGSSGTSGLAGESGSPGTSGTSGSSGTSGTSGISPTVSGSDNQILTSNGTGGINAESLLTFDGTKLRVLYQSGDEGGEILLKNAETNTTLSGEGVVIDINQNRLRFFEEGGTARGFYLDISAGGAGASTNLLTAGTGGGGSGSSGTSGTSGTSGSSGTSGTSPDSSNLFYYYNFY